MTLKVHQTSLLAISVLLIGSSQIASALDLGLCKSASSEDFGTRIEFVEGGPKIQHLSQVSVKSDLTEEVFNALSKAKANAEIEILRFLGPNTCTSNGCTSEHKISTHKDPGEYLRMFVPIEQCYTPGKFVRVKVEFSPDTIKAAKSRNH